jgi:tripartite-type tricarboxylate transporter receptor subunit TctC
MRPFKFFMPLVLGVFACLGLAYGQDYPAKPVHLVVPYPPGGGTDLLARVVAKQLSEKWNKPVIIDNKGGAAGMIGGDAVAKAPPDGYTLVLSDPAPFVIVPHLYENMSYNPATAFAPVTVVARQSPVLVVGSHIPVSNIKELLVYLKANPETSFGSFGNGSYTHVAMEEFAKLSGTKLLHVPYKGTAPLITDLVGGRLGLFLGTLGAVEQHEKTGRLKILAAATAERLPFKPDLPTVAESGVPGFSVNVWFGLAAPAGTPVDILNRIQRDMAAILKDKSFIEQSLTPQGLIPGGDSREAFTALMKSDTARWGRLIKEYGIKP